MTASDTRIHGIRHHGPGSARSLQAELEAYRPDCVLIEGPPDADSLIPLAADVGMAPPVALLVYKADDPTCAAFLDFAHSERAAPDTPLGSRPAADGLDDTSADEDDEDDRKV